MNRTPIKLSTARRRLALSPWAPGEVRQKILVHFWVFSFLFGSAAVSADSVSADRSLDPGRFDVTYLGQLTEAGLPANGLYDFRFSLRDAEGYLLVPDIDFPETEVKDGSFSIDLDFGASNLEVRGGRLLVAVRPTGTDEEHTQLLPEQAAWGQQGATLSQGGWFSLVATVTDEEGEGEDFAWPNWGGWRQTESTVQLRTPSDNVGIGTDEPEAKLHVEGDAIINGTLRAGGGSWIFSTPSPNEDMCQVTSGVATFGNASGPFQSIRVGVGTRTPTARLDVAGRARVRRLPNTTTWTDLVVTNGSGHLRKRPLSSIPIGSDSDWDATSNAPDMFSIPAGNVGIGTSTPTEKLHVNGQLRVDALGASETERVCVSSTGVLSSCTEDGWTILPLDPNWVACSYPGALPPQYFKDSSGIVHLKGCIKRLTPGVGLAFTMPSGFQADAHGAHQLGGMRTSDGSGFFGSCFILHVSNNGEVHITNGSPSMQNQTCNLIGVTWRGEL